MGNCRSHSRGCKTCVKRRVKCDERHPACARCEKAGFNCEGFRDTSFIDARQQVMRRVVSQSTASRRRSMQAKSSSKVDSSESDIGMNPTIFQAPSWPLLLSFQLYYDIPRSPDTLPLQNDVYVAYTVKYLIKGPLALIYHNNSLRQDADMHSHRGMMNECLLAMAKVFYGFHNRDTRVIRDGLRLYGRGQRVLSNILGKADCCATTEMIVSVFSLCVGESIIPTSKSSWMVHILGLERLFALQGPMVTGSSTVLSRLLLDFCRPLMIIAAFFTKMPSLMGRPEWRLTTKLHDHNEHPLSALPSTAVSDLSFLMETLAVLPALFLQCNECIRLAKTNRSPQACAASLWNRTKQLQQDIRSWKNKWDANHQSEVYEVSPITTIDLINFNLASTVFYFSNFELANSFTMYHSVIILLMRIPTSLTEIGLGCSQSVFSPSNYKDIDIELLLPDVLVSVQNICRSLEYYLEIVHPSQISADFYVFFPMLIARRASFQLGYSLEHAWLDDAFEKMKIKFPTGLGANMDFANMFTEPQDELFR